MTVIPLNAAEPLERFAPEAAAAERDKAERRAREAAHSAALQSASQQEWWAAIDTRIAQALNAFADQLVADTGAALADHVSERLKDHPGKLPMIKSWEAEKVHYANTLVSHDGSLYQAQCDTAKRPTTDEGSEWSLVLQSEQAAVAKQGMSIRRKVHSELNTLQEQLDVMRRELQSLSVLAAKEQPTIHSFFVDKQKFSVTLFYSNGIPGPTIDLLPLFEEYTNAISKA